jgi:hypothetical protein
LPRVRLHVTAGDDGFIASPDWLAAQLAGANRHFAPLDVGFQVVEIATLPASAAHIATRREREALSTDRSTGKVFHGFMSKTKRTEPVAPYNTAVSGGSRPLVTGQPIPRNPLPHPTTPRRQMTRSS